jgi:ADP-heptose:LPS heptosyltransferase
MVVKKSHLPDKGIVVHKGGLGDFMLTWPALHAIRSAMPGSLLLWVGNVSHRIWLAPLGIQPCPPDLTRAVNSLYSVDGFPEALRDTEIFWFILDRSPITAPDHRLHLLKGIHPSMAVSPREAYLQAVADMGVEPSPSWRKDFRSWFGPGGEIRTTTKRVLLFPGSGHPMKCWPLVQFFRLGRWLEHQGYSPLFVLGPAEVERELRVDPFPCHRTESAEDLQQLLNSACLVVGNDSGPMHLAGMLGLPGLVLFGPTSPLRWAPEGLSLLVGSCPEGPCSMTGTIACTTSSCMRSITQGQVRLRVRLLLQQKEDGSLRTVRASRLLQK